jgi:plasmid segregation protein ParM
MDDNRSDGVPGGASQIYQHIAALISRAEGEPVEEIELIDKALREQTPFFFYGKNIDLAPYLEQAQPLIAGIIHAIQNNVGRLTNVRSILLSGGGAALYATAIRRAFPRVPIEIVDAPCMANARGFLTAGEARLKAQATK